MTYTNSSINYLADSNQELIYKLENEKKQEAIADLEYFRNSTIDNNKKYEELNIFINMSIQSNAFMNFFNDESKYIGKILNIYFHKLNGIEFIFKIHIQDKNIMKRLKNIILNSDYDYHTSAKNVIEKYIQEKNINNYFIYY